MKILISHLKLKDALLEKSAKGIPVEEKEE
jgi:hypothetical protein